MKRALSIAALFVIVSWASTFGLPSGIALADRDLGPDAVLQGVLGRADAPVTVIEYSSLGCPHCADFHFEVLPRIKEMYIDNGKVRWIVRDFPLGMLALAGAVVAHCAGPDRYLPTLGILFRSQESWMRSADPLEELRLLSRMAGMSNRQFEACIRDDSLIGKIESQARTAQKERGIEGTPTFFVNGEAIVGAVPFETFKKFIDAKIEERSRESERSPR
jgi:protein-disulfide isomerase